MPWKKIPGQVGQLFVEELKFHQDPQVSRFLSCFGDRSLRLLSNCVIELNGLDRLHTVTPEQVPEMLAGAAKVGFALFGIARNPPCVVGPNGEDIPSKKIPDYDPNRSWRDFVAATESIPNLHRWLEAFSEVLTDEARTQLAGVEMDGQTTHVINTGLLKPPASSDLAPDLVAGMLITALAIYHADPERVRVDGASLHTLRVGIDYALRSGSPM